MNKREIEEKYVDVLHNIEMGIVSVYRENESMTDWDALRGLETVLKYYQSKVKDREPKFISLNPLAQTTYERVLEICEMTLGNRPIIVEVNEKLLGLLPVKKRKEISADPKTKEEVIICLRRVLDSIHFWTKEAGRQGYLMYIDQFLV